MKKIISEPLLEGDYLVEIPGFQYPEVVRIYGLGEDIAVPGYPHKTGHQFEARHREGNEILVRRVVWRVEYRKQREPSRNWWQKDTWSTISVWAGTPTQQLETWTIIKELPGTTNLQEFRMSQ